MQNENLSERLIQFIEHVSNSQPPNGSPLRVLDLRLECRSQRLSEEADWSTADLESIEQEAARFGDQTALSEVLSGNSVPQPILADSWLHSPSPFAWT